MSLNDSHCALLGKPVDKVKYPASTICSQGWVSEVIENVLDKQLHDYIRSQGIDISQMNATEIETLESDFTEDLYAGATLSTKKMITLLASRDPDVTLRSEVLVKKGYDECENQVKRKKKDLVTCPQDPIPWSQMKINKNGAIKIVCMTVDSLGGGRMTTGDGDSCVEKGAHRLRFALDDSTLQDRIFEEYCSYQDKRKHLRVHKVLFIPIRMILFYFLFVSSTNIYDK